MIDKIKSSNDSLPEIFSPYQGAESPGYNVEDVKNGRIMEGAETSIDGEHCVELGEGSNKRALLSGEGDLLFFPQPNNEEAIDIWEDNIQKWRENDIPVLSEPETGYTEEGYVFARTPYVENTPFFDLDKHRQEELRDDFTDIALTYDFLHRNGDISYSERPIQWDKLLEDKRVVGEMFETPGLNTEWIEYSELEDPQLRQELRYKASEAAFNGEEVGEEGDIYFKECVNPREIVEELETYELEELGLGLARDIVYVPEEDHLAVADWGEPGYEGDSYPATQEEDLLETRYSTGSRAMTSD